MKFKLSFKAHSELFKEGFRYILAIPGLVRFSSYLGMLKVEKLYSNENPIYIDSEYLISNGFNTISLEGDNVDIVLKVNSHTWTLLHYIAPFVVSKIYSGFSNSNRINISKAKPVDTITSYELVFRFYANSFNNGRVLGNLNTNIHGGQLEVPNSSSQPMQYFHPSSSYQWESINYTTTLVTSKWYYTRIIWENELVKAYLSEDGVLWNEEGNVSTTGCGWNDGSQLGADSGSNSLDGKIDIYNSYMKFNGQYWLDGRTAVAGVDYTVVGSLNYEEVINPGVPYPVLNLGTLGLYGNNWFVLKDIEALKLEA